MMETWMEKNGELLPLPQHYMRMRDDVCPITRAKIIGTMLFVTYGVHYTITGGSVPPVLTR